MLIKLKQNYKRLTKAEKNVADYVIKSYEKVPYMSVKELSEAANSSSGAIMRLIKKLEYESFNDMKMDLIKEDVKETSVDSLIVNEDDDIGTVSKKLQNGISELIEEVTHTVCYKKFEKFIEKLQKAECIYIFGVGGSGIVAMDLYQKILRMNKRVVFHQDTHMQLATSVFTTNKDVVIAFSYSGQTREVISAVKTAVNNGAYTMCVTKSDRTELVNLCNYCCFIPNTEGEFRWGAIKSRYADFYISDLIDLSLAQRNFEYGKECVIKTRNAIKEFEQK